MREAMQVTRTSNDSASSSGVWTTVTLMENNNETLRIGCPLSVSLLRLRSRAIRLRPNARAAMTVTASVCCAVHLQISREKPARAFGPSSSSFSPRHYYCHHQHRNWNFHHFHKPRHNSPTRIVQIGSARGTAHSILTVFGLLGPTRSISCCWDWPSWLHDFHLSIGDHKSTRMKGDLL